MPRSKRARIVHTSKVQKKPNKERATNIYTKVQAAAAAYRHIFVFGVENMRNTYLKDVRQHFGSNSTMFFGKTKVIAKALGSSAEDEAMPGVSGLTEYLQGSVGLLCTDRNAEEVLEYFEEFAKVDFARAGVLASRTFTVPAGVVYSTGGEQAVEDDVPLPHSLEATLRKWGMPTRLDKGKVMLDEDYVLCKEGKTLNSNQTALLKLFGVAMAEFSVQVLAHWSAASQEVTVVNQEAADRRADGEIDDTTFEGMNED